MPAGGARNRSGPRPQIGSARSERAGARKVLRVPAVPYDGPVPEFPLEQPVRRELEVWSWSWQQPQGWAWSRPENAFRVRTIGLWVRASVRAESPEAQPTLIAQSIRLADQIGMTTAGLHELGWIIGEIGEITMSATPPPVPASSSRSKLRVVAAGERTG